MGCVGTLANCLDPYTFSDPIENSAALFGGDAKAMYDGWGLQMKFDNTLSKETLAIKYRPIKDTMKDMVDCLIQTGYIPDKRKVKA